MSVFARRLPALGSVLFSVWLLSSCYYDPYSPGYNSGGHHGGGYPHNNYNSGNAYNTGVNYGRQDANRGRVRQASRHWNAVPVAERGNFAKGYNAGYQQGGGHHGGGGGNLGPGQAAFQTGVSYGTADARRGLVRQASRHWNKVAAPYRKAFAQGYNVGYQRG